MHFPGEPVCPVAGRLQVCCQGQDAGRLRLRRRGELDQGVPQHAVPRLRPRHQPKLRGDRRRGVRRAALRQEEKLARAAAEDLGVAHQREGSQPAGIKNELHPRVAVPARVRHQSVRGEVPRGEEGGAAGGELQQDHEDDAPRGEPSEDVEVLHHEGLERQLGDPTYDDSVRG